MTGEFTDAEGLISPDTWPCREGKLGLAWVGDLRETTDKIGDELQEAEDSLGASWRGMSGPRVYEAPEAQLLFSALNPVLRDLRFEAEVCATASAAMDEYTGDITSLEQKLRNAATEATTFRNSVSCGVTVSVEELPFVRVREFGSTPALGSTTTLGATFETLHWYEHRPTVERNQELIAGIAQLTEQVREAQARLAKRLTLVDDVGGRGRVPLNLARVDALAPGVEGDILLPPKDWFETASDEAFAKWWNGLEDWEQEAAINAVDELGLDSQKVGDQIVAAIEDAAERPDGYDDVVVLDGMLRLFGEDEKVMEHALLSVGVGGLAAGIHGIGRETGHGEMTDERCEQKLRTITALRDSLTEVSAGWDLSTAREFVAEQDLDDARWYGRPELGFLFADEYDNPMSKNLTIAMADQLDVFEREDLGQAAAYYEPPMSDLRELLLRTGQGEGTERINDPTARVLGTLGQYPNAALEWLSVGTEAHAMGEERLRYYFAERASADGFEGVAALWKGALLADGGPQDPTSYDQESLSPAERDRMEQAWHDIAAANTLAIRGLAANETFSADALTERGGMELGAAFTLALPHLVDTTVMEYSRERADGTEPELALLGRSLPGVRGVYSLPNVSREAFEDMYRVLTASSEAADVMADGARSYQDGLVSAARAGAPNPEKLIERGVVLQGMIDGVEHGREVGQARMQTEAAEARIRDAIGLIPTPKFGDKAIEKLGLAGADGFANTLRNFAVKKPIDSATGQAVGGVKGGVESDVLGSQLFGADLIEEYVPMLWTGHLAEAEARIGGEAISREQLQSKDIAMYAEEFDILPRTVENWDELSAEERTSRTDEYPEKVLAYYNYVYEKNYHVTDGTQDQQ